MATTGLADFESIPLICGELYHRSGSWPLRIRKIEIDVVCRPAGKSEYKPRVSRTGTQK